MLHDDSPGEDALDLRGGRSLWEASKPLPSHRGRLKQNTRSRILIIGSGITGSFLAERLSRMTSDIVVVDRHQPQTASTAASTALLQWELDSPLRELASRIGTAHASQIYCASAEAVRDVVALADALSIACQCASRPSLYLAGNRLGPRELKDEQRIRESAGLPSVLLTRDEVHRQFGFAAEAALYSEGAAEANPVMLAHGLMAHALARGVRLYYPEAVVDYDLGRRGASVLTESGHELGADFLILANGYEMPDFVPSTIHRISSTWALATKPNFKPWPGRALIWEASTPYLYARHSADNRAILGGEDEDIRDATLRDQKIGAKSQAIQSKFKQIYPDYDSEAEFAWSGFFGVTKDAMPLIGALPDHPSVFTAFGYGGNGITFSAMAAALIAEALIGHESPLLRHFRIDRD